MRKPQVGDVLYTSWGYDQTNAEFFQVVGLTPSGKSVRLRRIGSEVKDGRLWPLPGEWMRDHLLDGNIEEFVNGEWVPSKRWQAAEENGYTEVTRRWSPSGDRYTVKINGVRYAWMYQGGGVYDTYAAGLPGH